MGHLVHGLSLALPSHVDRYGFLTTNGSTGGLRVEAAAHETSEVTVRASEDNFMASRCKSIQARETTEA